MDEEIAARMEGPISCIIRIRNNLNVLKGCVARNPTASKRNCIYPFLPLSWRALEQYQKREHSPSSGWLFYSPPPLDKILFKGHASPFQT